MIYLCYKDILSDQLKSLYRRGGGFKKAADQVHALMNRINFGDKDPFKGLNLTNSGETRINKCIKYDLPGYCRLITIKDNGVHAMLFVGNHDECEKWLDSNKGYTLAISEQDDIKKLKLSDNITQENVKVEEPVLSDNTLLSSLKDRYQDLLLENIRAKVYKKLEELDSFSDDDEILEVCEQIQSEDMKSLVLDVLTCLRQGDVDGAKNRILLFEKELERLESVNEDRIKKIESNENFILLEDFEKADITRIMSGSNWYDWMLFLHPQQRKVVEEDFNGPARLLGVSGSGKTCVAVKRAIRLAQKYKGEKILITTINVSLADLITKLIEIAVQIESDPEELKDHIEVKSFWQLSKEIIEEFETDDLILRSLDQFADKSLEDVDQIWDEYYRCEHNNNDAKVFAPVQKTLLSRDIYASEYIRQEMDWIRSAVYPKKRSEYLTIEREGRYVPLTEEYRKVLLQGLDKWEDKMEAVGVSDYLGLQKLLYNYEKKLTPRYRSIIVDELQDFGTTELYILRKLVERDENDLFLCGDIAQQVQTKSHKMTQADIRIQPANYKKIVKNYRNSREILEAASEMFQANTKEEQYKSDGFELLKPEYANFSTPKPFLRRIESFKLEIEYALAYMDNDLEEKQKGCVAICGLSFFQVQELGKRIGKPVLDGKIDIDEGKVFLSDLNQTKGFEFDKVIIVNCSQGVFPEPALPEEEHYKEISKLYVAMTRAKTELIISHSGRVSDLFNGVREFFNIETQWPAYVALEDKPELPIEKSSYAKEIASSNGYSSFIGENYLRLKSATGLSTPAQVKLAQVVTGKNYIQAGKQLEWKNLGAFIADMEKGRLTPQLSSLLGRKTYEELLQHFKIQKR